MNKWQIICPVAAMLVLWLVIAVVHERSERRSFISVASYSIGHDLITATNSSHLVRVGPDLQARLSELVGTPTLIPVVVLGDEPPPIGDGTACSRLVLTNDAGKGLSIRLRLARDSDLFEVLGFRSLPE